MLGLSVQVTLIPQLLHSLVRLRIPLLSLQPSFLRMLRCLLSRPRLGGFPQDLLLLDLVTRGPLPSRRIAIRSQFLPLAIPLLLGMQSLFMTSVRTRVHSWMTPVILGVSSRVGSASLRPRLLGLTSICTPRVAEVEAEVTARAGSLARRSKSLSTILTSRYHRHAVADLPHFASSLAVNPSFSQLAGAKAVGSKRWGSISFSKVEKLERVFRSQLEMTSKSLWLLSGILAMLKRDSFQPADPTLFNAALASASVTLSQQAHSSASGSTFLRAKRRDSLLAHTAIPVPETQRRALTVSPGSETLLFDEEILGVVVSQVQQSSLISSNLAMSRSLARGGGRASSSPFVDPSPAGVSCSGRPRHKCSSSASRSGGRKSFRGGNRSAPSSGPSGFRKWESSPCLTLSGGCLSLHWQAWRDRGAEPWVVEVLRCVYHIPFLCNPPLSKAPTSMPSYHPSSTKGVALREVTQALVAKCAVELAPLPSLGFYSRMFVVWKTSGS